ncbi:succinyl-CoA ligase subunit alpha [Campylobacterota bacterium]|nr:succinyl-CoA ligase subunit alpha [Campylobacterota bacterium]
MQCELPTKADVHRIAKVFDGVKTVAIAGCSPDPTKASNSVAAYLQKQGFTILPIYPKEDEILGEKVYRSLGEIVSAVDMVIMFRKSEYATELVAEAIERGDIKVFWMQEGITNENARKMAEAARIVVVEDRCAMKIHQAARAAQ